MRLDVELIRRNLESANGFAFTDDDLYGTLTARGVKWVWSLAVEAPNTDEARQRAVAFLKPQHRDKPTRLQPETAPGVHSPPPPDA